MSKFLEVPYDWAEDVAIMLSRLALRLGGPEGEDLIENAIPFLMSAGWTLAPQDLVMGVEVPDGVEVRMGPDPTPLSQLCVGTCPTESGGSFGWVFMAQAPRIEAEP